LHRRRKDPAASSQGKDERAPKGPEMRLLGQNALQRLAARSLGSTRVCIAEHRGDRSAVRSQKPPPQLTAEN